jgi:ribonucleotide reductase beta subunit family protein with ferritin-like domain
MIDLTNREGMLNENIVENFAQEITTHELKHFYAVKCSSNNDHDLFYSHFIENVYAQDPVEQLHIRFLDGLDGPIDNRKMWIQKWTAANQRAFAERLIASIAMERIFNITNKCVIEKLGVNKSFPGLMEGKIRIEEQQKIHHLANIEINNSILIRNASPLTIREIIQNATEFEIEYAQSMNHFGPFYDSKQVTTDIMAEADKILQDLNIPKIYNISSE